MKLGRLKEAGVEKDVCDWAESVGIGHFKLTPVGQRGWNDRLFLLRLRPMVIEFKSPGEDPRRLQEYRHQTLRALGYDVQTHHDKQEAIDAIKAAVKVRAREEELLTAARAFGRLESKITDPWPEVREAAVRKANPVSQGRPGRVKGKA